MTKTVRLWIRQDGEQPKAVACDATKAPGPGVLVDVVGAKSADAARAVYALAQRPEPSEADDPQGWTEWRAARRAVKEA